MKVSHNTTSFNSGQFLHDARWFEEFLLKETLDYIRCHNKTPEKTKPLVDYCTTKDGLHEDLLYKIFQDELSISYDLFKNLQRGDSIDIRCFSSKSKKGSILKDILSETDTHFIIERKAWSDKINCNINLQACHWDYEYECIKSVITGETL